MINFRLRALPAAAVAAGLSVVPVQAAMAGTATTQLNVSAQVLGSCTVTATPVSFGVYDPSQDGDLQAQGTITLQCASGTTPVVKLSAGQHAASVSATNTTQDGTTVAKTSSGVAITRSLQNQGSQLGYDLFTDSGYSTVWNSTNTISPGEIGSVQPETLTVYGDIPAQQTQTLAPGSFSDTVLVTVTF
jgi:spore coat protein U-like protein